MLKEEYKNLKILYVEDEEFIRINAISYLKRLFNNVYEASNVSNSLEMMQKYQPHIVITDIKMPGLNGLEMIRNVRENDKETYFIVLSAFTDTKYLLDAIDLGLVKYLIKPIRHEIIYPLLINCAKEIFTNSSNRIVLSPGCEVDMLSNVLIIDSEEINLSNYEIKFLKLLCKNISRAVTYEELQNKIWSDEYMSENAVRLLVRDLRKKLPKNNIKNISKLGYKIELFG